MKQRESPFCFHPVLLLRGNVNCFPFCFGAYNTNATIPAVIYNRRHLRVSASWFLSWKPSAGMSGLHKPTIATISSTWSRPESLALSLGREYYRSHCEAEVSSTACSQGVAHQYDIPLYVVPKSNARSNLRSCPEKRLLGMLVAKGEWKKLGLLALQKARLSSSKKG